MGHERCTVKFDKAVARGVAAADGPMAGQGGSARVSWRNFFRGEEHLA
jgi:hypothetical protein